MKPTIPETLSRAAYAFRPATRTALLDLTTRYFARIAGTRGVAAKRDRFAAMVIGALPVLRKGTRSVDGHATSHARRWGAWKRAQTLALAEAAAMRWDEHGYHRGSYRQTRPVDFVPPWEAKTVPYCDMGGAGLGLIEITRTTVYARSSKWGPSSTATRFLIGRNEVGTYFAHPVPKTCMSVAQALDWIWGGHSQDILARQGDIALVRGAGPKLPSLPARHRVEGSQIVHPTHPAIRVPGRGERIIVGRRAAERAAAAVTD